MRRWAANVGAPLAIGAMLYLGFRTDRLLGWQWADAIGVGSIARSGRSLVHDLAVPDWVRFSLPDALWVYALAYAIARVQRTASNTERGAWLAIVLAFGPGVELGQLAGWVRGTFDIADLALTTIAFVLGMVTAAERALVPEEAR